MDFVELKIFKAVVEHGGINKAAAALHRVQSSVTVRVKQLEDRLGAKLFHRQGRQLILSAEGKIFLGYAERILSLSDEARAALKGETPRGLLRIGSLESTAATRLPPILSRYHMRNHAVRLELVTGTTGALVKLIHNGDVDAAFVAEPYSIGGLEREFAFLEELVLITPRSFPRSVVDPRDIGPSTVIAFTTGCSYRRRLETWLGRRNVVPERVMEYGSYHAIVACTAAGGGIAVVPKSVLRTVGAEGQVTVHQLPPKIAAARTMLVWKKGHSSSALDALRKEVALEAKA
jgi:DNA-binding transcriptional LysR family regulator